ncbi:DUF2461 family protein [Paractinoplanes brasiliensis]|uniref:Uncharacterized protein (TIGR02453 family) n=1 Tax=Paractinoplanes brasiliensis TaxID=52695 RepID=A0A4R6J9F6_9ACTN|nr:DUF2461 family protein [Actinoplanes brasiliensis]TDO32264.1 uncharacterized protein (TIGR02453 family) [Actinoplanes brasiliensis]GID27867.1 hypothetical protein Abr02nite_28500 [Actinoplanes brasiliensis]
MPIDGEQLFWELVEPLYADPAVQRSTMMGLPCVRLNGRFFASLDRRTAALLVKLPADRVAQLITAGDGEAFAPAGRVFREWVAMPQPDRDRWRGLLAEARDHAAGPVAGAANTGDHGRFAGFAQAGLDFLAGLEHDNTKRFFDDHRSTYQRELLEPAKAFIVALGAILRERVTADLRAEPRVGGSLFRIANDLRFTPSRPPYKPHLDIAFWQGPTGPRRDPSLILRLSPTTILLGAGVMPRTGPALRAYRDALRDPQRAAEIDRHVTALEADGAQLSEPTRARPPAGFDPTGPATRFAVRDGFHLTRVYPHPRAVTTPALVEWCADRLTPYAPLHRWLTHAGRAAG